jgi:hypothetical protein
MESTGNCQDHRPKLKRRLALKLGLGLPVLAGGAALSPSRAAASAPPSETSDWHAFLTDEERQHPLARYWYHTAPIAEEVLAALRAGPIDPARMLRWEERTKLSAAGDLPVENGWCMLPDHSGFVAVRTRFPGCTAAMIDWWFEWAQKEENIRYKIWYPGAHFSMAQAPMPDTVRKPGDKAYWGMSRFPVEDVGMGTTRFRLDFYDPVAFGFEPAPEGGTILCARIGLADGWFKHSDFIHHVRPIAGGVEMRSRFWMARRPEAMAGGWGVLASLMRIDAIKQHLLKPDAARGMAFHCAQEYSQLASFLPELHATYA